MRSRELWRQRPLARAVATGEQLDALAAADATHLGAAAVHPVTGSTLHHGMCGRLQAWPVG